MVRKTVPAGQFKAKCLSLLDDVEENRVELVITKRGRPVARLVPITTAPPLLFGRMKGSIAVTGDIVGPLNEAWEADA